MSRCSVPMGEVGIVYTVLAEVSGGWFIFESYVPYREAQRENLPRDMSRRATKVFHISIMYLAMVFVALALTRSWANRSLADTEPARFALAQAACDAAGSHGSLL